MSGDTFETVLVVLCFVFLVTVLVGGLIISEMKEEKLKHETCYTVYGYDVKSEKTYIKEAYCGEGYSNLNENN